MQYLADKAAGKLLAKESRKEATKSRTHMPVPASLEKIPVCTLHTTFSPKISYTWGPEHFWASISLFLPSTPPSSLQPLSRALLRPLDFSWLSLLNDLIRYFDDW